MEYNNGNLTMGMLKDHLRGLKGIVYRLDYVEETIHIHDGGISLTLNQQNINVDLICRLFWNGWKVIFNDEIPPLEIEDEETVNNDNNETIETMTERGETMTDFETAKKENEIRRIERFIRSAYAAGFNPLVTLRGAGICTHYNNTNFPDDFTGYLVMMDTRYDHDQQEWIPEPSVSYWEQGKDTNMI